MLFLFFRISYLHEFITSKIHVDLHLFMVLGALSVLAALITGRILSAFHDRIGTLWLCFAGCLCLATLTSTWRGGSIPLLSEYLRTVVPLLILIPAVVNTRKDLITTLKTMGWAGVATVALGFTNKQVVDGRMTLVGASSIGDSNDYAAQVMFVFPILVYLLFVSGRNIFLRVLGLLVILAGLYQLLSTGSRGALVSAGLTLMVIVIMSKPTVKVAIVFGVPIFLLLAVPFIPGKAAQRFQSLFSDGVDKTDATASSNARRRLLNQSIALTISHPLFGVGPGQFMTSEGQLAKAEGQRGMWHQTHNTFTQVSSECGIPAFLFFTSALGLTFVRLLRARKNSDPVLSGISQVVSTSMFGFGVCVIFLSHAYDFPFLISSALSISIERLLLKGDVSSRTSRDMLEGPILSNKLRLPKAQRPAVAHVSSKQFC